MSVLGCRCFLSQILRTLREEGTDSYGLGTDGDAVGRTFILSFACLALNTLLLLFDEHVSFCVCCIKKSLL